MVLPWKALKEGCRLRHGVLGLHSFHLISDRLFGRFFLESRIGCAGFFESADLDMDGFGKSVTRRDGLR